MSDGATGTSHAGAVKERAGRGLSAHLNSASKDIVALGIAFAAIIMIHSSTNHGSCEHTKTCCLGRIAGFGLTGVRIRGLAAHNTNY